MKLNEKLWAEHQYSVLASFIHHLGSYRVLKLAYDGHHQKSEFWIRTI